MTRADLCRCPGHRCPSAAHCRRTAALAPGGHMTPYAAFHARREPGADKCDQYLPAASAPATTYREAA